MPEKQAVVAKVIESHLDLHRPRLTTTTNALIKEASDPIDDTNSLHLTSQSSLTFNALIKDAS